jgi:hypothetical protein
MNALFPSGRIVATRGAIEAMSRARIFPHQLVDRHVTGDWGEVSPDDARENELSVREGFRILSVYTLDTAVQLWTITEADRRCTTLLLPEEY